MSPKRKRVNFPAIHSLALRACIAECIAFFLAAPLSAQSTWELTPYRVNVLLAVEDAPQFGPDAGGRWAESLRQQIAAVTGAAWEAKVAVLFGSERSDALRSLDQFQVDDAPSEALLDDKLIVLAVSAAGGGARISAREFDCRTRGWGPVSMLHVAQRSQIPAALFRALLGSFRTIAKIQVARDGGVTLRMRAAERPARDPTWAVIVAGDVFQPILRRNDREGNPAPGGIQPIPWTFLLVEEVSADGVACSAPSGMRSPLAMRRRGRAELLALAAQPKEAASILALRSRTEESRPLAGYEIHAAGEPGEPMQRLGLTNDEGEISISADSVQPVRMLYIKHGGEVLARLPVVPGLQTKVTATVADDDVRLSVEAELFGLEQDLIDTVARREVLLARTRSRVEAGNLPGAEKLLGELKRLPTRTEFTQRVRQLRNKSGVSDAEVKAKIDRLLRNTEEMLGKYLDPAPVTQIEVLYNQAARG